MSHNWGCYFGVKSGSSKSESGKISVSRKLDLEREYVENEEFVSKINGVQSLWRATHYPQMRGQTLGDLLRRAGGLPGARPRPPTAPVSEEVRLAARHLPDSFDWRDRDGANFVSPIRNQEQCGSCYAFASMAMMESRLRILTNNSLQVVLSPQDVVGGAREASPTSSLASTLRTLEPWRSPASHTLGRTLHAVRTRVVCVTMLLVTTMLAGIMELVTNRR